MNRYDLRLFDDNNAGTTPAQTTTTTTQTETKPAQSGTGYSFAQAEEIANARASRAEKAALASYFKQQGLTEEQITDAIKAYKAAQEAKNPKLDDVIKERDKAQAELDKIKNEAALVKKGVRSDESDYVMFKIEQIMAADQKLKFDEAAEKFLKENPRFLKQGYRVKTETEKKGEGSNDSPKDKHAAVNAAIRNAVRRR